MFLLVMGFADFLVFHHVDWATLTSFVVRNAVNEGAPKSPDEKMYHRVFVLFWLWAVFILIQAYAGNILDFSQELVWISPNRHNNYTSLLFRQSYSNDHKAKIRQDD